MSTYRLRGSDFQTDSNLNPNRRPPHPKDVRRTRKQEITAMNRYEASIPRAACGLAAIAVTAAVFAVTVMLPSGPSGDERILALTKPARTVYLVEGSKAAANAAMADVCDEAPSTKADGATPLSAT
jgi:hypothetical protein